MNRRNADRIFQRILFWRDNAKVIQPATGSIPAHMVEHHPFRDPFHLRLVNQPMNTEHSPR